MVNFDLTYFLFFMFLSLLLFFNETKGLHHLTPDCTIVTEIPLPSWALGAEGGWFRKERRRKRDTGESKIPTV